MADYFGASLLTSGELVGCDFSKYANVAAWLDRVEGLEAYAKVNEVHDGFVQSLADESFVGL